MRAKVIREMIDEIKTLRLELAEARRDRFGPRRADLGDLVGGSNVNTSAQTVGLVAGAADAAVG